MRGVCSRYLLELVVEVPIAMLAWCFVFEFGAISASTSLQEALSILGVLGFLWPTAFAYRALFGQLIVVLLLRYKLTRDGRGQVSAHALVNLGTMGALIIGLNGFLFAGARSEFLAKLYALSIITVAIAPFATDWVVNKYRQRKSNRK